MLTHCYCNCTVNPLILSPARSGALVCKGRTPKRAAEKCGPGAGEWAMSRWEDLKMLLLALAISVALATAGALLAIGMAHL